MTDAARRSSTLIRDKDAPRNLEIFLLSAIATILITRVYLVLTGYPQIGGGTLHIAHMLWGGLLMLAALVLFISYLNIPLRVSAALIGGIGFGLFIDEVGKFVTADNDYFFQPTFAILYVIFVGLFLLLRSMFWVVPMTDEELQVNAQVRSIGALNTSGRTPLVRLYFTLEGRLRELYDAVADRRQFRVLLVTVFVVLGLAHGATAVVTFLGRESRTGWVDDLYLAATGLSGVFVLAGIVRLKFHRLQALRLFRLSITVSLLFTQVFLFYRNELAAMGGLLVDLATYAALNTMIDLDKRAEGHSAESGPARPFA
jgi:hypothetical protein